MKYLGIDFGLRRVGLATSDGKLASPFKIIEGKGFKDLLEKVLKEASGFDQLVVGKPEGKIGQTTTGFIKALRKNGLNVIEADETLSSKMALEKMIEANTPKEKRKLNDDVAAAIILQNWIDKNLLIAEP